MDPYGPCDVGVEEADGRVLFEADDEINGWIGVGGGQRPDAWGEPGVVGYTVLLGRHGTLGVLHSLRCDTRCACRRRSRCDGSLRDECVTRSFRVGNGLIGRR